MTASLRQTTATIPVTVNLAENEDSQTASFTDSIIGGIVDSNSSTVCLAQLKSIDSTVCGRIATVKGVKPKYDSILRRN